MYAKPRTKLSILLLALAILFAAGTAQAQSAVCTNGYIVENGVQGSRCAPATCPDGTTTSCSGTTLCIGSTLNDGSGTACVPPPAATGALARDGIFGCSASRYQNPGSLGAVGGVYVPVNDAAVTLNTGYLVYKECVLDGVVSAVKNDAVAGLQRQVLNAAERGRGGNAQYLKNFDDLNPYFDGITVNIINGAKSGSMCGAFKSTVPTAVVRNYIASSRGTGSLACPFGSDAERLALVSGNAPVNWSSFNSLVQPGGYEISEYYILKGRNESAIAQYDYNTREMLGWSRGVFPTFDNNQNPLAQRVITPGYLIADSISQMLGAGTNILLNANEIDQVNGALQAGLSSAIVTDVIRGLAGLVQSQNGQPSYLDRMAAEASAAVRAGAVNAALSILGPIRATEMLYKQAKEATAAALTNAIIALRSTENACWDLIIPEVEEYASSQGESITVATSTEGFAQRIIDAEIAPIATTTVSDLRASETALALINQLIASVTNSSSAANQQAAMVQLDSLIVNGRIHSAQDAQAAQTQSTSIQGALTILLDDTRTAWGDSSDPDIGWCNINNPDVITMWFDKWRQ